MRRFDRIRPDVAGHVAGLMLRTERGALRSLWRLLYGGLVWALVRYLRLGGQEPTVFARGSFGAGEPVYGLSDVDLVVVVADGADGTGKARERMEARLRRLWRVTPGASRLFAVKVYEDTELLDAVDATVLMHGLRPSRAVARVRARSGGGHAPDSVLFGDHPLNRHYRIRTRPGLDRPTRDWRRLSGPDRRPDPGAYPAGQRIVAAWLELQCWWLYAGWACCHPRDRQVPYICFKLIAEAARTWLWAAHGEWWPTRAGALQRGLSLMPSDEPIIRIAEELRERLTANGAELLPQVIDWYVGFSARLAQLASRADEEAGATAVSLEWAASDRAPSSAARQQASSELPLVDWRGLVMSDQPDDVLSLWSLDPSDPVAIATGAMEESRGRNVAMSAQEIIVMPTSDLHSRPFPRGTLRAVQCRASDPVSYALVHGHREAMFSEIPGWSVHDWARRAVAENHARLASARSLGPASRLGLLFCAARAGLFAESVASGEPRLALTSADVGAVLASRSSHHESVATSGLKAVEELSRLGRTPPSRVVTELEQITLALPAFRARGGWS